VERSEEEKRELLHELRKMETSPAWEYIVEILLAQAKGREQQILLNALRTSDEVAEARLMQAERLTFKLLTVLPRTAIEGLEAELNIEEQNNERTE